MAKSANSKVIFLPATNQTMPGSAAFNADLNQAGNPNDVGEPSHFSEFAGQDQSFQQAINARVIENI